MADSSSMTTSDDSDSKMEQYISGTTAPVQHISAYEAEQQRLKRQTLPNLPSHKFRYSNWHDLSKTEVKGDQLHAPRVRHGPPEKEKYLQQAKRDDETMIHHARQGKERKNYQNQMENWENNEYCDLGYQDLDHGYQHENFLRVLRRLLRVQALNLNDDGLRNLRSVTLPVCTHLTLNSNYLDSFKKLPRIPYIESLSAEDNCIEDLNGIEALAKTPIRSLSLKRNPVEFTLNYRQRVFQKLPNLLILDGIQKLPEDEEFVEDTHAQEHSSCTIS